jgi:hypothetical protein
MHKNSLFRKRFVCFHFVFILILAVLDFVLLFVCGSLFSPISFSKFLIYYFFIFNLGLWWWWW